MLYSTRRLLIIPLIFAFLFQILIPLPSMAAENTALQNSAAQDTKVNLEQAIQIVRDNFTIPKELINFTSSFSNYNNRQSWSLNWNNTGEPGGSFSAQVDAVSGEILSIYSWKSTPGSQSYTLPNYSLEQARTLAEDLVKRLVGSKYDQLAMDKDPDLTPLNLYGPVTYTFQWQRVANGIPVQGNGVNLQIEGTTGQVTSYSLSWNNLELPKSQGIIDIHKAAQAFSEGKLLELQYFLPPVYRIMASGSKEQVQLVYQLNRNGYLDAFTGKPLVLNQEQWISADEMSMGMGAREEAAKNAAPLTPQEQKEVDLNTTLLTKDEALKEVGKWLEIPSSLSLRSMNLSSDGGQRDARVWFFEWSSPNQAKYESITARVDAVSGELVGFYFYYPPSPLSSNPTQKALTKPEAKELAEQYLKRIQPGKFEQVRLKQEPELSAELSSKLVPSENPYYFNYERIVNGIAFISNGINISVDPVTQKITSYSLNWWNLDFPQLSQALGQTKAEASFLNSRPLELKYVIIYTNGEPKEAKLVYQPATKATVSDIMDARTGDFLNWQGKLITDQPRPYLFTDISGIETEKEITVLGLAGLFGEYGNSFKPAENLRADSFLKSLLLIKNSSQDTYSLSAEEVLKKAKELGWLKEELNPSQAVSRELFSKIIIRYLGLEKVADLDGIYKLSFQDGGQIPAASQGYISLAAGLKILPSHDNQFEPARSVTRVEAAHSIIQALGYGLRF